MDSNFSQMLLYSLYSSSCNCSQILSLVWSVHPYVPFFCFADCSFQFFIISSTCPFLVLNIQLIQVKEIIVCRSHLILMVCITCQRLVCLHAIPAIGLDMLAWMQLLCLRALKSLYWELAKCCVNNTINYYSLLSLPRVLLHLCLLCLLGLLSS